VGCACSGRAVQQRPEPCLNAIMSGLEVRDLIGKRRLGAFGYHVTTQDDIYDFTSSTIPKKQTPISQISHANPTTCFSLECYGVLSVHSSQHFLNSFAQLLFYHSFLPSPKYFMLSCPTPEHSTLPTKNLSYVRIFCSMSGIANFPNKASLKVGRCGLQSITVNFNYTSCLTISNVKCGCFRN
jgi:hypothetical protein